MIGNRFEQEDLIKGDLVLYEGEVCVVEDTVIPYVGLQKKNEYCLVDLHEIKPLPLSEQIVDSVYPHNDGDYALSWSIHKGGIYHIQAENEKGEIYVDIKYAHELRHILTLLGIKKPLRVANKA